jgi:hypothetical protein
MRLPRISCSATEEVSGAVASVTVEQMLTVRATVEASPAVGQMYFERALDDVHDLLGKTLLMELVSSELDASEHRPYVPHLVVGLTQHARHTRVIYIYPLQFNDGWAPCMHAATSCSNLS